MIIGKLENERTRIVAELSRLKKSQAELSQKQGDEVDRAVAASQATMNIGRINSLAARLRQIDIARSRKGHQRLCLGCGGRIPTERIEAIPEAVTCIICQQEDESLARTRGLRSKAYA